MQYNEESLKSKARLLAELTAEIEIDNGSKAPRENPLSGEWVDDINSRELWHYVTGSGEGGELDDAEQYLSEAIATEYEEAYADKWAYWVERTRSVKLWRDGFGNARIRIDQNSDDEWSARTTAILVIVKDQLDSSPRDVSSATVEIEVDELKLEPNFATGGGFDAALTTHSFYYREV